MSSDFKKFIKLAFTNNLDFESTKFAFDMIMTGKVNNIQISSFLSLLQQSGIKAHHISAAVEIMNSKMISIKAPQNAMDTCGTGGDEKNTLNISTASAILLAAKGIPIAKHGNRALTSNCGSADVLKALKVNIDLEITQLEDCLNETNICFMFAPNHHPAMKYVGPVRQELGIRTIFNMLGPLLNPANVKHQLVGVYSKEVYEIYKEYFNREKHKNICLILGHDGNDEISLDGKNLIYTSLNNFFEFDPININLQKSNPDEMKGKDPKYNANRILEIFRGKKDSFYETVCINSAFGILLHDSIEMNYENVQKAYNEARSVISNGLPLLIIEKLIKYTNK